MEEFLYFLRCCGVLVFLFSFALVVFYILYRFWHGWKELKQNDSILEKCISDKLSEGEYFIDGRKVLIEKEIVNISCPKETDRYVSLVGDFSFHGFACGYLLFVGGCLNWFPHEIHWLCCLSICFLVPKIAMFLVDLFFKILIFLFRTGALIMFFGVLLFKASFYVFVGLFKNLKALFS